MDVRDLRCPISLKIMKNPVRTKNGFVYEKKNIERWFASGKDTEPITNQKLEDFGLEEDTFIKDKITARKTCVTCKTKLKKSRVCSKCMIICYCSTGCQRKDWVEHKKYCRFT